VPRARRGGMTLPEVVVAAFVVALATLVVVSALVAGLTSIHSARSHMSAESLAMDRLWTLFNTNYEALCSFPVVTETVPTNSVLFPLAGTIRTGVEVYTNRCVVRVRVDWLQPTPKGQEPTREELWAERQAFRRGSS
jgi:hypothetical protein